MTNSEDFKDRQKAFCKPNLHCIFVSAIPVNAVDKWGKDYMRLDLEFREMGNYGKKFHIIVRNPKDSAEERRIQANFFHPLCEVLGGDFKDIPPMSGWEEFVQEMGDEISGYLTKFKDKKLFIKLTINENGMFKFGTDRSVSRLPDMYYSEEDCRFLDLQPPQLVTLDHDTQFLE